MNNIEGCEFCGIKENCNNYKLGLQEGREGYVKILDFKKYNGGIEKPEDVFEFVESLLKCSNCSKDFYDKRCPTCYSKEGFVKIEDVLNRLDNKIAYLEKPELPINQALIFFIQDIKEELKSLAQKEKTA